MIRWARDAMFALLLGVSFLVLYWLLGVLVNG
jgi:hypothetical protein